MCHFDNLLDPFGIFCAFLILCCLMEGNILIHEYQVMEMMWLFPFQMLVWIHWYEIFLAFYSQVWYIMSSVFTRSKGKLVFMLH